MKIKFAICVKNVCICGQISILHVSLICSVLRAVATPKNKKKYDQLLSRVLKSHPLAEERRFADTGHVKGFPRVPRVPRNA